jgi:hypothetical protein
MHPTRRGQSTRYATVRVDETAIPFDPKNMLGGNLNADSDSIEGGSETETLGGGAALASGAS